MYRTILSQVDTEDTSSMFAAFRLVQPYPLRAIKKEFEIARLFNSDHVANTAITKIDFLKNDYTKNFLKDQAVETA